ncbi:MAG: acylphosphatase [Parafilimonas sp.]
MTAKHILIKGKVQGVFFRKNTKQLATDLNINGWVKNTDDGNVEILAQATEDAVEEFIRWCKQGPPGAGVKDVEIKDTEVDDDLKNFSIKY